MWGILVLVLIVGVAAVVVMMPTADVRVRFLQRSGFVLMAAFTVLAAVWIAGEAFADPGGWQAVGLTAAWVVPLVVLSIVAWRPSRGATAVLGVLTGALIVLNVWVAVDPDPWRAFENGHGPVRAIASFAVAAPIAVLGRRRPLPAAVLLLALAVLPMLLAATSGVAGLGSLSVVSVPPFVTGVLYLAAVLVRRSPAEPRVPLR